MTVRLIAITPEAEKIIGYCARVSNPKNQHNTDVSKLLGYCIKNNHWSIFEMANMVLEIETSRAIAQQILRHRSFSFQEFSQRYAEMHEQIKYAPRRTDVKNRQNSIDDLSQQDKDWFMIAQDRVWEESHSLYTEALKKGIAKESARFLLPLSTKTKIYMNGSVRSWIHYLNLRTDSSTQLEHRQIAEQCKSIFIEQLGLTSKALGWA